MNNVQMLHHGLLWLDTQEQQVCRIITILSVLLTAKECVTQHGTDCHSDDKVW